MSSTQFTAKAEGSFTPITIEKERVGGLSYPKEDVLLSLQDRKTRRERLVRATRAGNLEKIKFRILFEDRLGLKEVYTTIWATTEVNIILKHGVSIPIHRIHTVKIA
jgi:uncharacterized protein (UPF0248 family)